MSVLSMCPTHLRGALFVSVLLEMSYDVSLSLCLFWLGGSICPAQGGGLERDGGSAGSGSGGRGGAGPAPPPLYLFVPPVPPRRRAGPGGHGRGGGGRCGRGAGERVDWLCCECCRAECRVLAAAECWRAGLQSVLTRRRCAAVPGSTQSHCCYSYSLNRGSAVTMWRNY